MAIEAWLFFAYVGHSGDIVEELRKKNHGLKQRGGSTDSEMINMVLKQKCGPSEILKHPRPVEYAQYDVTPQAYVSTSRKSPFKASTSSKVLKESTNSIPFKVNQNNAQTLNANGYASVGHIGDIVEELRKKNHRLKQRGGSTDSEMINSVSAV
ncbi:hypothetical protein Tco_1243964 [Tanacetum coccineum]